MKVTPETNDPIYWATVYRLAAVNFRLSAEKLLPTIELRDDGTSSKLTAIPFYFLISHAIELLLKSILLKRGYEPSDLRRFHTRHNLDALLKLVENKGLPMTDESRQLIVGLSNQHKEHLLRYHLLINPFMPDPNKFWPLLDELLSLTRISTHGR